MRAIRKREAERGLVLDELPIPEPGPDEVLVQIEAASICGTDLHINRWDTWSSERVRPPLTLGHELCGTVVAVGRHDRDGGFADYVAIPASVVWRNERSKIPPELACLQEPFGNAVFATSTQDLAGRAVAVLGGGPGRLFPIALARAFRSRRV